MVKDAVGHTPQIHPSVRLAENACVIGDVTIAEDVGIWYGSVIRGDADSIFIDSGTNIQDNCVLHNAAGIPLHVGKNVTVGHGVILHSCTIGDNCLIGMGAIVMNNCTVGEGSFVGAGALLTENKVFPPNSLIMGSPARVVREVEEKERFGMEHGQVLYVEEAREQLPLASDPIHHKAKE